MDYGQIELAELRSLLTATDQPAWLRAVGGSPVAGVVPLWHAEVVVGPLDHRAERVWRYEECTFVSATISAAALAGTLEAGATQSLLADHVTLSFGLNTHCNFQRKPCFAQFDEPRLAWPSVLYTVGLV